MANFDELGKKVQDAAGAAAEKVQDLVSAAAEKVKLASENAKLTVAIISEQREIEKNYKAIGEWFVSEFDGEIPDAVKDVVAAVNASKAKIAELEASRPVKDEAEDFADEPADPELKTCSVCGAASNSKFCPDCGAPMEPEQPAAEE